MQILFKNTLLNNMKLNNNKGDFSTDSTDLNRLIKTSNDQDVANLSKTYKKL
jgi:hypothetical protein